MHVAPEGITSAPPEVQEHLIALLLEETEKPAPQAEVVSDQSRWERLAARLRQFAGG
jgi:hypothetical protein